MDFSIQHIVFILLVICTGLSAGLCFTWSNTVTPGIGRLDDLGFLMAFQQMNRVILNPTFFAVFIGPVALGIINLYLFRTISTGLWWVLLGAVLLYVIGVMLVTIFGNVPLNEMIDQHNLETMSVSEITDLRTAFEEQWNRLHLIRTISSVLSFISLIIITTQITNKF